MAIDILHLETSKRVTVELWSQPHYAVPDSIQGPIRLDWFLEFVRDWGVARTLKGAHSNPPNRNAKMRALGILNEEFFDPYGRFVIDGSRDVDVVAGIIRHEGLTPRNGTPISLVSKIAYFGQPDIYPPWDRYACQGLAARVKRGDGFPYIGSGANYEEYFANWNVAYGQVRREIRNFVNDVHWAEISARLELNDDRHRPSFCKKIMDCVLSIEGGRRF